MAVGTDNPNPLPDGRVPGRSGDWGVAVRRAVRNPQVRLGVIVLVPTTLWYTILQAGPILEALLFLGLRRTDLSESAGSLHDQ